MATETYELSLSGTLNASYRETVMHFTGVGVASGDTLAAGESLILGFRTNLEALFLATLPASYFLILYQARRATPKPSAVAHTSYGAMSTPGTRGSNANAQQTCPSIFMVPPMGTKSGGRIFWPAIPNGDLVQSNYSAGWQTAVNAYFTAAIAGFTQSGITWTQAIYSRKLQTASTIVGHNFSPLVGFQGRRRKPVGAV